jgi:aspartyl-tRNA(Asn)/glutamyl-tRNA(Gln) amidotransferase subunit A
MLSDDICNLSITELAGHIKAQKLSPVEVTAAYLQRIEQLQPMLNAYIEVGAERAMATARVAEIEIMRDGPRSELHGIPLAHKDIIDVAGMRTTCGSQVLEHNFAKRNATAIDRLDDAGAILLGKLNMNEFATLVPSEHYGSTVNPWAAEHTPGGSSSGSGVAVASGLCAAALGTDTGGSIRIPATFCGVTGLKATHGRISTRGVVPLAWALDHLGPLARSARDASLMLDVLAAYDAEDLTSRQRPFSSASSLRAKDLEDLSDLKIAIATDFSGEMTDHRVLTSMAAAVAVLRERGAQIKELEMPCLDETWLIAETIIQVEATTWHAQHLASRAECYGPKVRTFLERGQAIKAQDYVTALQRKEQFKRDLLAQLDGFDALIAPGALVPPPRIGARTIEINGKTTAVVDAVTGATCPFNLSGQPVLSVPTGRTRDNLPLGIQIIAHPWNEHVALRIGQSYQTATDWHVLPGPEPLLAS